jgi:hypothetical protein
MFNELNTVKSLIFAGTLFRDFVILCLYNSPKIHVFGRVVIEKPIKYFHIRRFYFRDHTTLVKIAKIKPTQK